MNLAKSRDLESGGISLEKRKPNRRGRPRIEDGPVLDRERLAATLLDIARHEGVTGLQMRPVASALGVSPKVLYGHVTDKQGMLEILVETILDACMPDVRDKPWDETLRAMAGALHQAYKPFPGVLDVVLAQGCDVLQQPYTKWFHATAHAALTNAGIPQKKVYHVFVRFAVIVMGSVLYEESNARSADPSESQESLDQCFEENVEMFLKDVERMASDCAGTDG
ncbi:TetR/AcrR family transcriptional regulator [Sphingobium baderi]|uniref:TetR/AcrR family transcriptional regulator n=1 Tax=Sphingobium baderi TaxID=1332080 RepID=UPI0012E39EA0|nr:TetR/AcrR family transcriptional regulator [Sphingobium baderi]